MTAKQAELWAPSPGKSGHNYFPGLYVFTHPREMCFCKSFLFIINKQKSLKQLSQII